MKDLQYTERVGGLVQIGGAREEVDGQLPLVATSMLSRRYLDAISALPRRYLGAISTEQSALGAWQRDENASVPSFPMANGLAQRDRDSPCLGLPRPM